MWYEEFQSFALPRNQEWNSKWKTFKTWWYIDLYIISTWWWMFSTFTLKFILLATEEILLSIFNYSISLKSLYTRLEWHTRKYLFFLSSCVEMKKLRRLKRVTLCPTQSSFPVIGQICHNLYHVFYWTPSSLSIIYVCTSLSLILKF